MEKFWIFVIILLGIIGALLLFKYLEIIFFILVILLVALFMIIL